MKFSTSKAIAIGVLTAASSSTAVAQTTLYSIGQPTAKEQLYVELINRARANPTAEGIWLDSLYTNPNHANVKSAVDFFLVDRNLMKNEFITGSAAGKPTLNVAPPLAINAQITAAARLHSQDQINNDFQGHRTGGVPSGLNASQRMAAQGYTTTAWGENVFVAANNVFYGHAGFQIDWGFPDGAPTQPDGTPIPTAPGMQGPPRGHRRAIHSQSYREIGVGNLTSVETTIPSANTRAIGPEIVTQDFATAPANTPFITGVAYYDLNGNNFYDIGEGAGGIDITCTNTSYHAVTSNSGGYAIPVSGNGSYTLSFMPSYSASATSFPLTIAGNDNLKQDLKLTYSAPVISGPMVIALNDSANYEITPVPGASSYTYRWGVIDNSPTTEDADQGSAGYTTDVSSGYTVVQSTTSVSGNAFRLFDSSTFGANGFRDQIMTLTRNFTPGGAGTLNFRSRLSFQFSGQFARVQVSEDNGATWSNTSFNQQGPASAGESSFSDRSVDLSAYAGKSILIRFNLDYVSGSLYTIDPNGGTVAGWYIDNITFSDMEETLSITEQVVSSGNSFLFGPSTAGTYRLNARANTPGGSLPYGDSKNIIVRSSAYTTWLANNSSATGGNAADPEADGISNLLEYAFGLNPATADAHQLPSGSSDATHFTMSATRPGYAHSDLTYAIEQSSSLEHDSWTTVKTFGTSEELSYSIPHGGPINYFYRWKITLNP